MDEQSAVPAETTRIAVMDLGTNTFHLLIAESAESNFNVLYRKTDAVKLGEGGINQGIIQPAAYDRGIATIQEFKKHIDAYQPTTVRAIATSALRNAANGEEFIAEVFNETGIQIHLISGEMEAAYIYNGIRASGALGEETTLVMDIGGGSVEFIIGNAKDIFWKQSFEIGAARLMDLFHQTDPIPAEEVVHLWSYLNDKLGELFAAALVYQPVKLIGSSGAFETFAAIIEADKGGQFDAAGTKVYDFVPEELIKLTDLLELSSHEQRAANPQIIPVRVDMIVVAAILTRYIFINLALRDVSMSIWSLKEGAMAALMNGEQTEC